MVGKAQRQASPESIVSNAFDFDETTFRAYCWLYLRPHDRASGLRFVLVYGIHALLFVLAECFLAFIIVGEGYSSIKTSLVFLALVFAMVLVMLCVQVVVGVMMLRGVRAPKWGTSRWESRTNVAYERMIREDTDNPINMYSSSLMHETSVQDPCFVIRHVPFVFAPTIAVAFADMDRFDEPLAYDLIPGVLPKHKDPGFCGRHVFFSADFLPDCIIKGSHGVVFAQSYADVHDVVEDKRYPNLAIVRHENGYDQLVVRTDMLEGGTWEEVEARIAAAKGE